MVSYDEFAKIQLESIAKKEPTCSTMRDYALLTLFVDRDAIMDENNADKNEYEDEDINVYVNANRSHSQFKSILSRISLRKHSTALINMFDGLLNSYAMLYPPQYDEFIRQLENLAN